MPRFQDHTRAGFHEFRICNPSLRYGQAFITYFGWGDGMSVDMEQRLFFSTDHEWCRQECEQLMDNWQIDDGGLFTV
jgi:hypothetical protein